MRLWNVDFKQGAWEADVMIVMAESVIEAEDKAREYLRKTYGAAGARKKLFVNPTDDPEVTYISIEIN
jgi:hypothetical protein